MCGIFEHFEDVGSCLRRSSSSAVWREGRNSPSSALAPEVTKMNSAIPPPARFVDGVLDSGLSTSVMTLGTDLVAGRNRVLLGNRKSL
jgi:hypothetical protein